MKNLTQTIIYNSLNKIETPEDNLPLVVLNEESPSAHRAIALEIITQDDHQVQVVSSVAMNNETVQLITPEEEVTQNLNEVLPEGTINADSMEKNTSELF